MESLERIPLCDLVLNSSRQFKKKKAAERRRLRKRTPKKVKMQFDSDLEDSEPEEDHTKKTTSKKSFYDDPLDEDYLPSEEEKIPKNTSDYRKNTKAEKISKNTSASLAHSESNELSEYEKMVLKNKQDKLAFLEKLKINELKEEFAEAVNSYKARPKTSKASIIVKRSAPPRRSPRILKLSPKTLPEEAAPLEEEEPPLPPLLPFSSALQGDGSFGEFSSEFRELDRVEAAEPHKDLVSLFGSLSELSCAKVVPTRATALALHPSRALVCAGSKYGHLGLWNTDSRPFVFEPHREGVTHVSFNPGRPHQTLSCSHDGTLRQGDIPKELFTQVFRCECSCLSFDFVSPDTLLVARKDGSVSLVDCRAKGAASKTHRCHDNPVKCVSVHPLERSYFVTAENRGALCVWDLRKLQRSPVLEVLHHRRCVHSALFSTGRSLLTTSTDDTICLFDSSNVGGSLTLRHSLKHNNHTGRWLTSFRASWLPGCDTAFLVGSMAHPRRIEVFDERARPLFQFQHPALSSVTSLNAFHPALPMLAGANSSGKVYVFTAPE